MKWFKTIKARWLVLIIVIVQLSIWLLPMLFEVNVALTESYELPKEEVKLKELPKSSPAASQKKSSPRELESVMVPKRTLEKIEHEIDYLEDLLEETTNEKLITTLTKRIDILEQEELRFLREENIQREIELEKLATTPAAITTQDEKPTLNTDQPTLLIYADWFLINWQALLSIFTILPIVVLRWKNLLIGKAIEEAKPE